MIIRSDHYSVSIISMCILGTLIIVPACNLAAKKTPSDALNDLIRYCKEKDSAKLVTVISSDSLPVIERYQEICHQLPSDNIPPDPVNLIMDQFSEYDPLVISERIGEDGSAVLHVIYADGMDAKLYFVREDGTWRWNLARELSPTVELMEAYLDRYNSFHEAKASGDVDKLPSLEDED